jgi:hypothetical protein
MYSKYNFVLIFQPTNPILLHTIALKLSNGSQVYIIHYYILLCGFLTHCHYLY